jgi:hypothetical protein
MSSKYNANANGASAESIINLAGNGNQYLKEDSVQMADDAKVVGGDNVEAMGTLTRAGADILSGGALKAGADILGEGALKAGGDNIFGHSLGDNSSMYLTAMDSNTSGILEEALAVVSQNANNMMALSAGRDPGEPLADQSSIIQAGSNMDAIKSFLDKHGDAVGGVAVIGAAVLLYNWSQKK